MLNFRIDRGKFNTAYGSSAIGIQLLISAKFALKTETETVTVLESGDGLKPPKH